MLDLLYSYYKQHPVGDHPVVPLGNSVNLAGKSFGRLTALYKTVSRTKDKRTMWVCICSCPKGTVFAVLAGNLTRGMTVSCGCKGSREVTRTLVSGTERKSLVELAAEEGVPYGTLYSRMKRGGEDTANHKKRKYRRITFNGKTMSLFKWSQETGIAYATLYRRIDVLGWSIGRALTQKVR